MANINFPASSLNPNLVYAGRLLGLLTGGPTGSLTLNTAWFEDPWTLIKGALADPADFLNLLGGANGNSGLLGTPDAAFASLLTQPGSTSPATTSWFPIPMLPQGSSTSISSGVHIVLPADSTTSPAVVGLGLAKQFTKASFLEITPFVYAPLFELPVGGDVIVTGDADHPLEVGIVIKDTKGRFQSGSVAFNGVSLRVQLYFDGTAPTFGFYFYDDTTKPPTQVGLFSDLASLAAAGASAWTNTVLADSTVDGWLRGKIGGTSQTPGGLLSAIKLLVAGPAYTLADLGAFADQTPIQVLFDILNLLAADGNPIIPVGSGGVYVVSDSPSTGVTSYGVRLELPDVAMGQAASDAQASGGTPAAPSRTLTLQLGKYLGGQASNDAAWIRAADPQWTPIDPGIDLYLLTQTGSAATFSPRITLNSIGFDYAGFDNAALVSVGGFSVQQIEARLYVDVGSGAPSGNVFGGVLRADSLALPIGSSFGGSGGSNPIANSLVASGGNAASGGTNAVNPAFSMSVAYVEPGGFKFQLYDATEAPVDTLSLPIQQTFGPLECDKIGAGWIPSSDSLALSFDGSVSLAGLTVGLVDLSIGIPVTDPTSFSAYQLDLGGLDVSFSGGSLSVSGGLLKTGSGDSLSYDGQAFITCGPYSVAALGAYSTLPGGGCSLFIFAYIGYPLGGPPFLFVTGGALGFGYNRSLIAPAQDQVTSFPLVAGVSNPSALGVKPGVQPDLTAVLSSLETALPPTRGEYWAGAGLQFTSFDIVNSDVLLVVEFGKSFEILILGLSIIEQPKGGKPYLYVELGIEVTIKPDDGLISATAIITPNSYVIDPACKVTGGFAFFLWFGDNPHAGDFVLTIGGYHPAFVPPAWYPTVPRLGYNWAISDSISIKGDAYFALTPSCVMAGGSFEALYSDGNLQAWFDAYADFLISWKPYFFSADIGVSIGVSYPIHILFVNTTIRIEIGAQIEMWGPPTGGQAHVDLWVVSFTVDFGSSLSSVETTTDWTGFKTMLPGGGTSTARTLRSEAAAPALTTSTIAASSGVQTTIADTGEWVVRPGSFTFAVGSVVPSTSMSLNGVDHTPPLPTGYFVGIRPMAVDSIGSQLAVTVQSSDKNAIWTCTPDLKDVPEAMWGSSVPSGATPPPAATLLSGRLMGMQGVYAVAEVPSGPPAIDMEEAFTDIVVATAALPLSQTASSAGGVPSPDPAALADVGQIMIGTGVGTVAGNRAALFAAFGQLGLGAGSNGSLAVMAGDPYRQFAESPLIGTPTGN